MPTEIEIRVMEALSSFEMPENPGEIVEGWGNEAVTVVCETALGTYPGVRQKVRTNAVALLGWMKHPQAQETILMLLTDDNPDISIRALRAAAAQQNQPAVAIMSSLLKKRDLSPVVATEIVIALSKIDSPESQSALREYADSSAEESPHRAHPLVMKYLNIDR